MLFSFMKKPNHKIFDYTPRFYDPSKDEEERRKRRLKFGQARKYSKRAKSPIQYIVLLAVIIFIYLKFSGLI